MSFAAFAEHSESLSALVGEHEPLSVLAFIAGYAGLVALSFPAAELLTIAGGFLFGRWLGTACSVVAATVGATLVFLAARTGFSGLAERAGGRTERFAAGFRRDALSYLLFLRLVPLFPFWLVNLAAAAAGLRLRTFVAGTFVGIIPGTFVYASIGASSETIAAAGEPPGPRDVLRWSILLPLLALAALALLPILWRGRRAALESGERPLARPQPSSQGGAGRFFSRKNSGLNSFD